MNETSGPGSDVTLASQNVIAELRRLGRHMPRDRHQNGRVEETGKRRKKWRGHYYIYVRRTDGTERRSHRAVILGLKSEMRRWEATQKLQAIITKETSGTPKPDGSATLGWFWESRYRPLREPTWKPSSRQELVANIERYVIRPFRDHKLADLDKISLQTHLNRLATRYSLSVVQKFRIWTRAILEEAVDQDLLDKNPARKLEMPVTRKPTKRVLTLQEIQTLLNALGPRDRLMIRMALVLGLRPGELLALRWGDLQGSSLRIDEATRDGKVYEPKTATSQAMVWLPESIQQELEAWRSVASDTSRDALVFPNALDGLMRLDNFRSRVLKTAAARAGLRGVTFQALRRTCATLLQQRGTVKDVQAHLRHAQASTTLGVYVQPVPESVRTAVEALDATLRAEQATPRSVPN